jgi:hypothetical protein
MLEHVFLVLKRLIGVKLPGFSTCSHDLKLTARSEDVSVDGAGLLSEAVSA